MEEIDMDSSVELREAVLFWTGWRKYPAPRRDRAAFLEHYGKDAASRLLPRVEALEKDFYESKARFVAADLPEMEKLSVEDFRKRHPNIDTDVAQALAWCYTFDFK